jgi:hypothetical protein
MTEACVLEKVTNRKMKRHHIDTTTGRFVLFSIAINDRL